MPSHFASYRICFILTSVFWIALVLWPSAVWQPPDRLWSHRTSDSWSHGSADNKLICQLVPSMCLNNNSFWKMLDFCLKWCSEVAYGWLLLPFSLQFVVHFSHSGEHGGAECGQVCPTGLCLMVCVLLLGSILIILLVPSSRRTLKHGSVQHTEKSCYFWKFSTQSSFILNYRCDVPMAVSTTWGTDQLWAIILFYLFIGFQ